MAHEVIGRCPVCDQALEVSRLHCPSCDTAIEGHFALGRVHQLTKEQLGFLELFVRCEGKLNKVQDELGISYPTARNRLNDLIRAMGFEVPDESPPSIEQRQAVLEQLAAGKIGSDQAIKLLSLR